MEAPVSASQGVVRSLPSKLESLLSSGSVHGLVRLRKGEMHKIRILKDHLQELIDKYLMEPSEVEAPASTARCWVKEVRELSYDIDDFVDELIHADAVQKNLRGKIARLLEGQSRSRWFANEISRFMARLEDSIQRHKNYHLDKCKRRPRSSIFSDEHQLPPPRLVGIDSSMEKLEEWLTGDGEPQLRVVTIVGFVGVGKTTLAKELFCKLGRRFECRAFVRSSQMPDMSRLLTSILLQVRPHRQPDASEYCNLIDTIRAHLQHKKYIIIIDDLWASSTWDIVHHAFPDDNCCSRVLTTTEVDVVAQRCCGHNSKYIFKMEPLSNDGSIELFFSRVVAIQSESHEQLNNVASEIIRKCGGFPLATVTAASLLSRQPNWLEQWNYIRSSLSSNIRKNQTMEGMKQVLSLCYNNLPDHLKACMLYFSIYKEDHIILKDDLIQQWTIEGFICAKEGKCMEEVASTYFDELVNGGMIHPVDINYNNGEVLSCTVHYMILNVIRYKSIEENFVTTIDHSRTNISLADKVRRLSLHFGDADDTEPPAKLRLSHVRSLIFFGLYKSLPSIAEFRLLRVLILHIWGDKENISFDLTTVSELFRLRYFEIACNVTLNLQSQLQGLQYLETLKIDSRVSEVPQDIVHLPGLLHLSIPGDTNLPKGIGRMASLQKLGCFDLRNNSADNVQSLDKLTNLRHLRLTCSKILCDNLEKKMGFLASVLSKLSNLKSLTLLPAAGFSNANTLEANASSKNISCDGLSSVPSPPALLEKLELSPRICILSRLPRWIGELGKLSILKIAARELWQSDIDILRKLNALAALSLYLQTSPAERIVFHKEGFPVLKHFKFICSALCLAFEKGAMPNVRRLKLGFNADRLEQYSVADAGFENLTALEVFSAKIGCAGAAESGRQAVKSALEDAFSNCPVINVLWVDGIFYGNKEMRTVAQTEQAQTSEKADVIAMVGSHEKHRTEEKGSTEERNIQADSRITPSSESPSRTQNSGKRDAMDYPITCSLGTMVPLLAQLHSLTNTDRSLPQGISKDELQGLIQDLEEINTSVMDLAKEEDLPSTDKCWMKEVREISYDAEDYLATVMHAGAGNRKIPWKNTKMKSLIVQSISEFRARLKDAKKWPEMCKLADLRARLEDANERHERCELADLRARLKKDARERRERYKPALAAFKTIVESVLQAPHARSDGPMNELVSLLAFDRDPQLKVVPIFGFPGVGKTTLARRLYYQYGGRFQCRAFLRVSRNPDPRRLLTSMLSQIKGPRPHGFCDVQDLTDDINKHLQGKTYLIIVDDLWDASVWDIIRHAFPAGNCCSRIITTTQIEVVALACSSYCSENIYKMRPPSNDNLSRQQFFGNLEVMKEVVNLTYNDLPPHLKTCLLYLSIYPEGYTIGKDDLVKQWVAEGFVSAVDGQDIEEVAGGYFDELVTRGMIQPVDTNDNDEVLSCTVHHMVLDFIAYKSMEENFVTIVDHFEAVTGLPDKVRRLSMKFGGAKGAQIQGSFRMSQVRSLTFFGFFKCVPSIVGYKLVRVLILHIWTDQDTRSIDLAKIGELFQLRYLKIECNMTVKLPTKILGLQYLGTLEIDARVTAIPSDIVRLQRLWHLRLPSEANLPNRIGCMTSLRSLGHFNLTTTSRENVLNLGKLTKLRDLHITCCTDPSNRLVRNMELLASILGKCSSLKSLVLDGGAFSSKCISCGDGLGSMSTPLATLERLELSPRICMFSSLPRWIEKLDKLCVLKIALEKLSRDEINILKGLDALAALSLYVRTAPAERIVFHKEGFKSLKHFKFICSALCLAFEKGAIPNVRRLELGFNAERIEQYSVADAGFENLTGLEVFTAKIGCAGAAESGRKAVQSALENAFRNCESHPVINVLWVDWIFYGDKEMSTVAQTDSSMNNARLKKLDEIVETEWEKVFRVKDEILKKVDELFVEIQIRGEYEKTRTQEEKYKSKEKQDEILEGDSDEQHGTKQKGSGKDTSKKPDSRTSTASEPSSYVQSQGDKEMSTVTQTEQPQTLGKADVITKGGSDEQHRTGEKGSTEDTDIQADSSLYNALIKKLDKLDSRARDKDEIVYIEWDKEALTRMIEELDSRAGELMEKWILQLQDLVYDIEDFIDVYNYTKSWTHADFDMIQHLKGRTEILRRDWQQWPSGGIAAASGTSAGSTLPVYAPEHELVGIDEPKRELMQFLELEAYDEQTEKLLRVISIVGCRGVGKTALARAVYEDPSVQREFEFHSWVVASECRDGKDLLDKIEQQVSQKLSVLGERFLVVIDELQRASVWYDIQSAFMGNRQGSRIIVTTSIESVAAACTSGSGSYIYRMRGLGRSQSKQLFWSKVGRENILYKKHTTLEEIFMKCGGLPLALISVANYLREKGQNLHQLELGPGAFEGVNRVLMQIYDSLPDSGHRKCLLSLSTIPKGYPIKRKSLIRRWIAEGLAVGDGTLSAEQVAGNRFDEFIDRNIIEPVLVGNKVKRCRVSPVILEFIVDKAVSKDMVALIRMNEPLANKKGAHPVRQLSIHGVTAETGRVAAEIGLNHHVRSLTVRDRWSFYLPFDIRSCRLLRVLDMEGWIWMDDSTLSDICRLLVLLKYLSLRGTDVRRIANGIRNLYDLETLDIRETQVEVLPMEVMMLPRLAHLFGKFQLPPELENAERRDKLQRFFSDESRLQTLSGFVIDKNSGFELILLHMRLLRKVKIWCTDDISIHTQRLLASSLEKRITGNSALESLSIDFGIENMNFLDEIQLEAPCMLSSIKLRGMLMRLPSFIASHGSNLSELQLSCIGLSLEDLSVLQHLRRLLYLKLVEDRGFGIFMGDKLIVESGGFPSLRRLCFEARKLPRVHIVKGGMRSLTSLHLYYMESQTWKPSDFNWEIENLENLQEVVLRYTVSDEELDAWKSRARSHINRPKVTKQPIEYHW